MGNPFQLDPVQLDLGNGVNLITLGPNGLMTVKVCVIEHAEPYPGAIPGLGQRGV